MKKRIITLLLAIALLFAVSVTASAANPEIGYDSSYNAETGLVSVSVYINNAVGLQSTDLNLAFDDKMYEFESYDAEDINNGMIAAGHLEEVAGLCTSSVIFMDKCLETDLDSDGRLNLITFTFKPLSDEYDINEFCLWVSSFEMNDVNIEKTIKAQGNTMLWEDKTDSVTLPATQSTADGNKTTSGGTQSASGELNSKWYVYLIAGVLAVGAIAGIAFVAIKSSHNENEQDDKEDTEKTPENSETEE